MTHFARQGRVASRYPVCYNPFETVKNYALGHGFRPSKVAGYDTASATLWYNHFWQRDGLRVR